MRYAQMHWRMLVLAVPAFVLGGCEDITHGTEERLRAAVEIIGAEYNLTADWMGTSFESRDTNTLVVAAKRGRPRRFELQEPERCKFRFTIEAGTPEATTETADLNSLKRLEVLPTMSGLGAIVSLSGDTADSVVVASRYGTRKENKLRLNNLLPGEVDAFLPKVAAFMEKTCGVKVSLPGS
ncbi:hypothetical protein [Bradyrhizobium sp. SZCCHNS2002]|uniref:hypothetical protein n=1 Tax=Bradyrhizobium sp. SZCCHNS2002 TaxID=3057302 RepID=UPI0029165778|nr:hypothetical protein [Bradyrhizobium sp. SZCCHNS2002]